MNKVEAPFGGCLKHLDYWLGFLGGKCE